MRSSVMPCCTESATARPIYRYERLTVLMLNAWGIHQASDSSIAPHFPRSSAPAGDAAGCRRAEVEAQLADGKPANTTLVVRRLSEGTVACCNSWMIAGSWRGSTTTRELSGSEVATLMGRPSVFVS